MKDLKLKLSNYINKAISDHSGDISISPSSVAANVIKQLDPSNETIPIISYGFNLQVRALARLVLGKKFGKPKEDETQSELFEGLQERYPAARNSDEYILREDLTLEQRRYNEDRLRKTGESFIKHSDALKGETDELEAQGFFSDSAAN